MTNGAFPLWQVRAVTHGAFPLWQVRAVTHGRVLVLDEADKAPLEVTRALRSLLAEGEMHLTGTSAVSRLHLGR